MTTTVQIAIDCTDPHRMAKFWASALGCTVVQNDADIRNTVLR